MSLLFKSTRGGKVCGGPGGPRPRDRSGQALVQPVKLLRAGDGIGNDVLPVENDGCLGNIGPARL